jgi:prostaglandin reductase 1
MTIIFYMVSYKIVNAPSIYPSIVSLIICFKFSLLISFIHCLEILVAAEYLSVDPYMRPYSDNLSPGKTMIGTQVAKILESKNPNWPIGKKILAGLGWSTHSTFNPEKIDENVTVMPRILPDFGDLPDSLALGTLGMPG